MTGRSSSSLQLAYISAIDGASLISPDRRRGVGGRGGIRCESEHRRRDLVLGIFSADRSSRKSLKEDRLKLLFSGRKEGRSLLRRDVRDVSDFRLDDEYVMGSGGSPVTEGGDTIGEGFLKQLEDLDRIGVD